MRLLVGLGPAEACFTLNTSCVESLSKRVSAVSTWRVNAQWSGAQSTTLSIKYPVQTVSFVRPASTVSQFTPELFPLHSTTKCPLHRDVTLPGTQRVTHPGTQRTEHPGAQRLTHTVNVNAAQRLTAAPPPQLPVLFTGPALTPYPAPQPRAGGTAAFSAGPSRCASE